MDDITPLQQLDAQVLAQDAYLFNPRPAYFIPNEIQRTRVQPGSKQFRGTNPEPGTSLHYYLREKAQGPVRVSIVESRTGKVVWEISGPGDAGINRVQWSLLADTPAAERDADDDASRAAPARVAPGLYRVTLYVNGKEQSRNIVVEN